LKLFEGPLNQISLINSIMGGKLV